MGIANFWKVVEPLGEPIPALGPNEIVIVDVFGDQTNYQTILQHSQIQDYEGLLQFLAVKYANQYPDNLKIMVLDGQSSAMKFKKKVERLKKSTASKFKKVYFI